MQLVGFSTEAIPIILFQALLGRLRCIEFQKNDASGREKGLDEQANGAFYGVQGSFLRLHISPTPGWLGIVHGKFNLSNEFSCGNNGSKLLMCARAKGCGVNTYCHDV